MSCAEPMRREFPRGLARSTKRAWLGDGPLLRDQARFTLVRRHFFWSSAHFLQRAERRRTWLPQRVQR